MYSLRRQKRIMTNTAVIVLLLALGVLVAIGMAVSRSAAKPQLAAPIAPTGTTVTLAPPPAKTNQVSANFALISTSLGDIKVELYPDSAPKTVTNFATLATQGFYNSLTFHRVVKDFVIQGGDPNGDGSGGRSIYGETFPDEINADSIGVPKQTQEMYATLYGYKYRSDLTSQKMEAGSLAMANRGADTNGSQFFIVSKSAQPSLDGKHTVFGHVVAGMDVVDKINNVEVGPGDRPNTPIMINKITVANTEPELDQK